MNIRSRFFRNLILILSLPVIPAFLTALVHEKAPVWSPEDQLLEGEISLASISRWEIEPLWVDARSSEDFSLDHIPNAILLNEDEWDMLLPQFLTVWQPGRETVVYCSSLKCNASSAVAARLKEELGLESVYVLKGGWEAWLKSNR